MNDDFFSDPLDDELRRRFAAATPRTPADPDAVLDGLRPQLRRARTRHRAALGGLTAGVVAVVAVAGFALTGGISNPNVKVPPATPAPVPGPDRSMPTPPQPTTPTTPEVTAPGGDDGGSSTSGTSGTSGDDSPATPTTSPAPQTQTFTSAGGSITVTLANGALSLAGVSPAAGNTSHVNKNEAGRIEVEFFNSDEQRISRIRVDLDGGTMVPVID
jgi:hypothetical protein